MNPVHRLLPARESLRRVHGEGASELDIAGVDMMLHLINAVDVIRATIYKALQDESGLSEGQFTLLMTLLASGKPLGIVDLSERLGVSTATTSVMVARMLKAKKPLVIKQVSRRDARVACVRLSAEGRRLLDAELPKHFARISEFASALSGGERDLMISLLKKLVHLPAANPLPENPQADPPGR